ncbi:endonuclease related [Holotrichia oblita]|uniref:Endonuclease related n=1 Tax=Holotrichia oblita TaxID=644536 RepID=A0ACB9SSF5_HOLOL|nr:endonuclease related [Holotrichia oblita]
MARLLKKCVIASGISIASFYCGIYYDKKTTSNETLFDKFKNLPGLPLYGTVSAATSFSPVPQSMNRTSQIMKYGFPSLDNVKSFSDYVLSYDRRTRVAHWVFEHLTKETVKYNDAVDRSLCNFMPDESIHHFFRAENSDYLRSGYDRGHLAAAGNHRCCQKDVEQTFYLSNMAPQVGVGFNRDSWNRLEKYVRKLTKKYINVYCCTGPLYLPRKEADGKNYVKYEVIGANNVAVPTHFFKIVVAETENGELHMESYVMPNQVIDNNVALSNFQVSLKSIKAKVFIFFLFA